MASSHSTPAPRGAPRRYLTIVSVMRDGSHAIHQVTDAVPAHVGVLVGAHIALRRERHGDELVSVVIINGSEVSELNGGQS